MAPAASGGPPRSAMAGREFPSRLFCRGAVGAWEQQAGEALRSVGDFPVYG